MGDTHKPDTEGQAPTEPQGTTNPADNPAGDPPAEPAPKGDDQQGGGDLWEGIPEDHPVRKKVADLNAESAARRVEARSLQEAKDELEAKIAELKTPEEFAAAIDEYKGKVAKAELEATKERVGRTYGLPDALVARLAGDTEEAIVEDAKALQALVSPNTPPPTPKDPPRGGLQPEKKALSAAEMAKKIASSRAGATFQ